MREGCTRIRSWLGVVLLLSCPAAAPAQQKRAQALNGIANAVPAASPSDTNHVAPAERNPRYRICRDDVLLLSFPLSPELNQRVIVQPDGFISLQNVGDVYVQGLTVRELVEAVKKAYAHTLNGPIVDVDLADFQKPFFTVLGQVGKPGQYDLRYDITVTGDCCGRRVRVKWEDPGTFISRGVVELGGSS